jgi:hypothetical protein
MFVVRVTKRTVAARGLTMTIREEKASRAKVRRSPAIRNRVHALAIR